MVWGCIKLFFLNKVFFFTYLLVYFIYDRFQYIFSLSYTIFYIVKNVLGIEVRIMEVKLLDVL